MHNKSRNTPFLAPFSCQSSLSLSLQRFKVDQSALLQRITAAPWSFVPSVVFELCVFNRPQDLATCTHTQPHTQDSFVWEPLIHSKVDYSYLYFIFLILSMFCLYICTELEKNARKVNVCTLSEYSRYFNLPSIREMECTQEITLYMNEWMNQCTLEYFHFCNFEFPIHYILVAKMCSHWNDSFVYFLKMDGRSPPKKWNQSISLVLGWWAVKTILLRTWAKMSW